VSSIPCVESALSVGKVLKSMRKQQQLFYDIGIVPMGNCDCLRYLILAVESTLDCRVAYIMLAERAPGGEYVGS